MKNDRRLFDFIFNLSVLKFFLLRFFLASVTVVAGLASIVGTGSNSTSQMTTACTGPHQYIRTGSQATLDGRCSDLTESAPKSARMYYGWQVISKPEGSNVALTLGSAVIAHFIADMDGDYVIELSTDTSAGLNDDTDRIQVTAYTGNARPMVEAGAYQEVATGDNVQLNASGFDADDDTLSYAWAAGAESLPASLSDAGSASPSFSADNTGDYLLELVVNDGGVDSRTDTVLVRARDINQTLPVAVAGPDQYVTTGSQVMLDAGNSYSAYDKPLSYSWRMLSRPGGSAAILADTSAEQTGFMADVAGLYLLRLQVNDGFHDSSRSLDDVHEDRLVVLAGTNQLPVADAGADQSVSTGTLVTMDGGASSDAEMNSLSYQWALIKRPAGSTASLSSLDTQSTQLTPDRDGNYLLGLRVNDGIDDSAPDVVRISASSLSGATALSLVGSLPFEPSGMEVATWIQVDNDGSDAIRATSPDDVTPGNFDTAMEIYWSSATTATFNPGTGWSIVSPASLTIEDSVTTEFIVERSSDGMYYRIILDFTVIDASATVQIDSLQAWRCGVNPADCP